jgi:hypothetical protein
MTLVQGNDTEGFGRDSPGIKDACDAGGSARCVQGGWNPFTVTNNGQAGEIASQDLYPIKFVRF